MDKNFSNNLYVLVDGPDVRQLGELVAGDHLEATLRQLQKADDGGNYDYVGDPIHVYLGDFSFRYTFCDDNFPIVIDAHVLDGSDNLLIEGLELLGARLNFVYNAQVRMGLLEDISQRRHLRRPEERCDNRDEVYTNFLKSLGIEVYDDLAASDEPTAYDGGSVKIVTDEGEPVETATEGCKNS